MGRTVLGMLAGLVTMWLAITGLHMLGHALYPPPPGLDPGNAADVPQIVAAMPTGAFVMLVLAWTLGAFAGAAVAARIAFHANAAAIAIGLVVMTGVVAMIVMVPEHPTWVAALGLLLPVPVALLAARLFARPRKGLPKL